MNLKPNERSGQTPDSQSIIEAADQQGSNAILLDDSKQSDALSAGRRVRTAGYADR